MRIFFRNNRKDYYHILVEDRADLYLNSSKMIKALSIESHMSKINLDFLNTLIFMNCKSIILSWMKLKKKKKIFKEKTLNCTIYKKKKKSRWKCLWPQTIFYYRKLNKIINQIYSKWLMMNRWSSKALQNHLLNKKLMKANKRFLFSLSKTTIETKWIYWFLCNKATSRPSPYINSRITSEINWICLYLSNKATNRPSLCIKFKTI
jgi:hypothetical protein